MSAMTQFILESSVADPEIETVGEFPFDSLYDEEEEEEVEEDLFLDRLQMVAELQHNTVAYVT